MTVPTESAARLADAQRSMRKRQYAAAIEQYRGLLVDDDRDTSAHEGLATAAFMLKDYDLAIEHFKRVTLIDPRRAQPIVNLGAVYNRKEDYNSAIKTLRKALAKDGRCAEAYYNLGLAHRGLSQSSMAVSAYKEAIRLSPEMAEAYQNLANVYVDMGNTQQAISQYERALQLRPGFERARRGLARAKDAQQKAKAASSPFGRLVDIKKQTKKSDHEAASLRVMTDQERFEDRQMVHACAKEMEQAVIALAQQLRSELEPQLNHFTRAFTQSTEARGYWDEFTKLREGMKNFELMTDLLRKRTENLRSHNVAITESLTRDTP